MQPRDFISQYKLGGATIENFDLDANGKIVFDIELIRANQIGSLSSLKTDLIPAKIIIQEAKIIKNDKNFKGFLEKQDGEVSSFALNAADENLIKFNFFVQDYSKKTNTFIEMEITSKDIQIIYL